MMRMARRAARYLGEAADATSDFVLRLRAATGGFADRSGNPDSYYTMFAALCLLALERKTGWTQTDRFMREAETNPALDLVHLGCLIRYAALRAAAEPDSGFLSPDTVRRLSARLAEFRRADGGYAVSVESPAPTFYGGYVAFSACCDLGIAMPGVEAFAESVNALRTRGGGYRNELSGDTAMSTATAGALLVGNELGLETDEESVEWLLARWSNGGFCAGPSVLEADGVSTAVCVYALASVGVDLSDIRAPCEEWIAGLWHENGGFCGHWSDESADIEHTFDALLTLGALQDDGQGFARLSSACISPTRR